MMDMPESAWVMSRGSARAVQVESPLQPTPFLGDRPVELRMTVIQPTLCTDDLGALGRVGQLSMMNSLLPMRPRVIHQVAHSLKLSRNFI